MYLQLGRIYWNENDLNNADRIFHEMVTHFPTSYAAYYFDGKVLSAQGKYDQAAQAFKQSLILEPSLEEPRFELIKIYQIQNKPADVTKTYQELLITTLVISRPPSNWPYIICKPAKTRKACWC